jgi:hypothetical protein
MVAQNNFGRIMTKVFVGYPRLIPHESRYTTRFPSVLIKPLSHLSVSKNITILSKFLFQFNTKILFPGHLMWGKVGRK